MDSAIIHIERKLAFVDALRSYKIFLDETLVGTIRQGKIFSFEVHSGCHEIFLTIDWCSSPHVSIDLASGEKAKLIWQAGNTWPWSPLYNVTYGANNYIKLFQETSKSSIFS